MAEDPLVRVFESQGPVCASFGSAFYGDLCRLIAANLRGPVRDLFAPWRGQSFEALMEAAVSLRFLGALHDLALSGDDPALAAAFPPAAADAESAWRAAREAIGARPDRLAAFMTHEPQTNEVRRAACLLPGFLQVAAETALPLRCLEIGASAGLNQLWHRFGYHFGAGCRWGDPAAPLQLDTDWTGPAPALGAPVRVVESRACDRRPIDLFDAAQRRRLKAYLWPDQTERLARFDAAAGMAVAAGVRVETADAAAWTAANAAPREGVATVLFHSIVWQYLPEAKRAAVTAALARHGVRANPGAPLAWLRMEPAPGQPFPIELRLTLWPGGRERRLALVHAHGASVTWDPLDARALAPRG